MGGEPFFLAASLAVPSLVGATSRLYKTIATISPPFMIVTGRQKMLAYPCTRSAASKPSNLIGSIGMSRMGSMHLGGGENSAGEGTGLFPRHENNVTRADALGFFCHTSVRGGIRGAAFLNPEIDPG